MFAVAFKESMNCLKGIQWKTLVDDINTFFNMDIFHRHVNASDYMKVEKWHYFLMVKNLICLKFYSYLYVSEPITFMEKYLKNISP